MYYSTMFLKRKVIEGQDDQFSTQIEGTFNGHLKL